MTYTEKMLREIDEYAEQTAQNMDHDDLLEYSKQYIKHIIHVTGEYGDFSIKERLDERNQRIYERRLNGETMAAIGFDEEVSPMTVCVVASRMAANDGQVDQPQPRRIPVINYNPNRERDNRIIQLRERGNSFSTIGNLVGLSRTRVAEIYNNMVKG
jgi:hypothetical protein